MPNDPKWERPRERRINNRAFVWVVVAIVLVAVAAAVMTGGFFTRW